MVALVVGASFVWILPSNASAEIDQVMKDSMNRATVEAGCSSFFQQGSAVRAAICISNAQRPVWAKHAPTMLDLVDAYFAENLTAAQKFDAKKISVELHTAEAQARTDEFTAKVTKRASQEQCSRVIALMGIPWLEAAQQEALLEKSRNIGCLR
jgi:hypothetical protein